MKDKSSNNDDLNVTSHYRGKSIRLLRIDRHLKSLILDACMERRFSLVAELCEHAIRETVDPEVELYFYAGKHRLLQKLPEQACAHLLFAVRKQKDFAAAYRHLGMANVQLGATQEACKYLRRATRLDSSDYCAWAQLSIALNLLGKKRESSKALICAINCYQPNQALSIKLAHSITLGDA